MAQGALGRTRNQAGAVAILAVAVAVFIAVAAVRHGFFDLKVYAGAIRYWVRDGGDIYDYLKPSSTYGFTYPPFAAFTMAPMAYLPWPVVIVLSVLATAAASGLVLWWLVGPLARYAGWTGWFTLAVAACLAAAFEPMRETVLFGQVNMLLLFLVAADLLWLVAGRTPFGTSVPARWRRWAGIGVGLATAIKLTPGVFIVYLLVTRRIRAALVAAGTAAAASVLAAAVAPDASRVFWTEALWNTDRVGSLGYISNQSLQGLVARLDPAQPSRLAWLVLVLAALAVWAWRARAAVAVGNEAAGFALTGVVGCLVSPVTWVHHLVWLLPALILLVDAGVRATGRRRRALLGFAAVLYVLLCSRLVWLWEDGSGGIGGFVGSNAYVWASLALLVGLPVRRVSPDPAGRGSEPRPTPAVDGPRTV
ncbi:glycosyltransferase 87 family protein [Plantactinospora siamensis]|uniref:Glycosyltransferase 87 family protein n=1 Tax=Plantactinospora siamensis TaxID=555372 RepID=A0ABV6NSP6_9ACTN